MANQELLNYVKAQLENKISKEAISANLLAQGWQQTDVDSAMSEASNPASTATAQAIPSQVVSSGDEKKNGMTIAALVVGILGFISAAIWFVGGPLGIIGLALGIMGLKSKKHGMAIASIILSSLAITTAIGYGLLSTNPVLRDLEHQLPGFSEDKSITTGGSVDTQELAISDLLDPIPYVNSTYNFEINMPKDWIGYDGTVYGGVVFYVNPAIPSANQKENDSSIAIVAESSQGLSLKEYVSASKASLPLQLKDYVPTSETPVVLPDGISGVILSGTFTEGINNVHIAQLLTVKNGEAFIVSGKSLTTNWEQYNDIVGLAMLTFTLN